MIYSHFTFHSFNLQTCCYIRWTSKQNLTFPKMLYFSSKVVKINRNSKLKVKKVLMWENCVLIERGYYYCITWGTASLPKFRTFSIWFTCFNHLKITKSIYLCAFKSACNMAQKKSVQILDIWKCFLIPYHIVKYLYTGIENGSELWNSLGRIYEYMYIQALC